MDRDGRSILLRARPFRDQPQLLSFAEALEHEPGIANVALVRGDLDDAWFSLISPSRHMVVEALERLEDFQITATPTGGAVEARLTHREPKDVAGDAEEEPLLPPRRRYRLFRPLTEPSPQPAGAAPVDAAPGDDPSPANPDVPVRLRPGSPPDTTGTPGTPPSPSESARGDHWLAPPLRAIRDAAPRLPRRGRSPRAPREAARRSRRYALIVAPFDSLAGAGEFQDAVLELPGVEDAQLRRFQAGMLQLAVDYVEDNPLPFSQRLEQLDSYPWRLVSADDWEVQIELIGGRE